MLLNVIKQNLDSEGNHSTEANSLHNNTEQDSEFTISASLAKNAQVNSTSTMFPIIKITHERRVESRFRTLVDLGARRKMPASQGQSVALESRSDITKDIFEIQKCL
jgi:hypothetical protein